MNWDEIYRKGEVFWNKGVPSPPLRQYLERQPHYSLADLHGLLRFFP